MRQFRRSDRLNAQILRDISQLLDRELGGIAGGITTFTAVRLTSDLRYARVFYSFLGDDEGRQEVEKFLERQRGRIRSQIGRNLHMRHIPELVFKYDPTVEQGIRIEKLLDDVKHGRQGE
ncbi:MAG TPA: 30S ribosome-binding factor RbfA [Acidobacteriota bacterium]|nr:30S ribosome-binding factor RbfA [Acidobacteriota bacterium]